MQTVLWPILRQAMFHPKRVAVIDDRKAWTYGELVGGALFLAKEIQQRSQRPHVGILLPTSGAFAMASIAAWMLGRTIVPVNYLLSAPERQYIIDDAELDLVITTDPIFDAIGDKPESVELLYLEKMSFKGFPPLRLPAIAKADDLAAILYTSGTSGQPKGVMLTHRNLRSDIQAICRHVAIGPGDTFLGVLPQFHSFGLTALTLLPLLTGAKVVCTARFVPRKVMALITEHRPTIFVAIPSMYNALLSVKSAAADQFDSLTHLVSGGEPLPASVSVAFEERFGVAIREGYGLTETSPVVAWSTQTQWRPGAVGRLLPSVEVEVRDDDGQVLGVKEDGEIFLRGPMVMAGYYKLPDLTAEVIGKDQFFRTGDWGHVDQDGFVYITGRKKEMMIIGGENVFPREIEEVLNQLPQVESSAVIGRMDPMRGEQPIAFIELIEDETAEAFDQSAAKAACRDQLAGFKIPKEIHIVEALPRNGTGKILRRALQDHEAMQSQ